MKKTILIIILLMPFMAYAYEANTVNLWLLENNGTDSVGTCNLDPVGNMRYTAEGLLAGSTYSGGIFSTPSEGYLYKATTSIAADAKHLEAYFVWYDTTQTNRYMVTDSSLNLYFYCQSGQCSARSGAGTAQAAMMNVSQNVTYVAEAWLDGTYLHEALLLPNGTPVAQASVTCGVTQEGVGHQAIGNFYAGTVPFNGLIDNVRYRNAVPTLENLPIQDAVNTQTMTMTLTPTYTETYTQTTTPTYTKTYTQTTTPTYTATVTETVTKTITPTVTQTVTETATPTFTNTVTATITMTPTITPTIQFRPRPSTVIIGYRIERLGQDVHVVYKNINYIEFISWDIIYTIIKNNQPASILIKPLY